MPDEPGPSEPREPVPLYDATYARFSERLYADVRAATHATDIGQNGWLTADEHDRFIKHLDVGPASRVLEIACGSGEPSLRLARKTGCTLVGIDIHADAVAHANTRAAELGLAERVSFQVHDAAQRLPFDPRSFDAAICIDAINHLADRPAALAEWFRVLAPGGRLLYTDPVVVSGPLSNAEIAARSSIGFFLFVPPDYNERVLGAAGFEIAHTRSVTDSMAEVAARWRTARDVRAHDLRRIEGDRTYDDLQRFLEVTARLARERRLSRMIFLARRPE